MPVTRKELALRYLRKQLSSGALKPGARLSDLALSREMGISRTPVREAINNLVAEGFAVAHPHAGVFVASLSKGDVRELYELREALESFAAARLAALGNKSVIAVLSDCCSKAQSLLKNMPRTGALNDEQRGQFRQLDLRFHQCIIDACGNARIKKTMDEGAIHRRLFATMHNDQDLAVIRRAWRMHQSVLKAVKQADPDAARAAMAAHIQAGLERRLADWRDELEDLPEPLREMLHDDL